MADNDDFQRVMARFSVARDIERALTLFPTKSVIVFCHHRNIRNYIGWLMANRNVRHVALPSMTVFLDDGRIVVFMNEYKKSWGYERSKFVVVNYL